MIPVGVQLCTSVVAALATFSDEGGGTEALPTSPAL